MGYVYGLAVEYLIALAAWIAAGTAMFWTLLRWRRKCRGQPGRLRWINLGLSAGMLLATLTALEIYFAVFYDQTDSFNMTNGSETWYRRHVEPYKNSHGFRDARDLQKQPPAEKTVIWFLGDSFTFGHGIKRVEDRFTDLVAQRLERMAPGKSLIHNVSDAGSNTTQVRGWMDVFWTRGYEPPDAAVYVLCLNDIEPYLPDASRRYQSMGEWEPPWMILKESYLLNFFWFRLRQSQQPAMRDYFGDLVDAYEGKPGNRLLAEIDQIQYICKTNRVNFGLVIFPFLHNLGPDYKFSPAHERLVEHCRRTGVPVLDLGPVLEPHAPEGLTVNRFDSHPNKRAHALAAEAITEKLLPKLVPELVNSQ